MSRAHIIAHPEKVLTTEQIERYENWVTRREQGEPVAYILGRKAFYDREFMVTPDVLIPRPETEHLLEMALAFVVDHPDLKVVDCGTGSGALAVTFAAHVPAARVFATDISPAALQVARENAIQHRVNVSFYQGDLLLPLVEAGIRVDLVMANLPYIASDDVSKLAVSQHEPRLALDGGHDGLDLIRRLLTQAPAVSRPGGVILMEIGADQAEATARCAHEVFATCTVEVFQDYAGLDRVVRVQL